MSSRVVLTYGSFDLFHQGHARLLQRLSMMGSELIVGCSTDAYNEQMGVPAVTPYAQRRLMLESCRDWRGQFDHLNDVAQVVYVPRAEIIGAAKPFHAVPQTPMRMAAGA